MDANVYPEPVNASTALCASCGAPLRIGAAICDSCGLPIPAGSAGPSVPAQPSTPNAAPATPPADYQDATTTAVTATIPGASQQEIAQPPQPAGPVRRCNWCGAVNPIGSERCVSCNATFPKAEQDDLLTRASRERLRLAMEDFEEADRKRSRSFFARLFG